MPTLVGAERVVIKDKVYTIEHFELSALDVFTPYKLYGCGWLPLTSNYTKLLDDLAKSQGPEWRG